MSIPQPSEYLVRAEHIGVKPYEPAHAHNIAKWLSKDPVELFSTSSSLQFPVSAESFEEYRLRSGSLSDAHQFLAVYHLASGLHIGHFEVKAINTRHAIGTLAHVLMGNKEFRARGLGKELCELMVRYGFITLGLHRLSISVQVSNRVAVATYVMGGFRLEGVIRDVLQYEGRRYSIYQMSLLRSEWEENPDS